MVGVQIAPLDEKEIFEDFNDTDVGGKGSRHRFSIVAGPTWPGLRSAWGCLSHVLLSSSLAHGGVFDHKRRAAHGNAAFFDPDPDH
jgi:hypothetical protein